MGARVGLRISNKSIAKGGSCDPDSSCCRLWVSLLLHRKGWHSSLLESVKRNPNEAKALCTSFRSLNSQGVSATSPGSIQRLASERGLSTTDAEILATYVIGLHCSDVS